MKKLVRLAAVSVMAFSFTTGVAAANAGSIDTTGPDSVAKVKSYNANVRRAENNTNVKVKNNNWQHAHTGDASVRHNTTGGAAVSGDAVNDALSRSNIKVNNSGASATAFGGGSSEAQAGHIKNTGPGSYAKVESVNKNYAAVENNTNAYVQNNNWQKATSGDAKVSGNTTAGDAVSGNATNISTNETTLEITN